MNPDQQRRIIASAVFKFIPEHDVSFITPAGKVTHECWETDDGKFLNEHQLPDYPNDLNAMHEAEKVFDIHTRSSASPRYAYMRELYRLVPEDQQPCRATAAQRAEAFLRTIGKWEG